MSGTTVRKFFWFDFDLSEQESWMNDMAAKGTNPIPLKTWLGAKYDLQPGEPGEWVYRIELLTKQVNSPETRDYLDFVVQSGAEMLLASTRLAYFRKRAADGPFDIYTDLDSRRTYYERLRRNLSMTIGIAVLEIVLFSNTVVNAKGLLSTAFDWVWFGLAVLAVVAWWAVLIPAAIARRRIARTIASLEAQRQVAE